MILGAPLASPVFTTQPLGLLPFFSIRRLCVTPSLRPAAVFESTRPYNPFRWPCPESVIRMLSFEDDPAWPVTPTNHRFMRLS